MIRAEYYSCIEDAIISKFLICICRYWARAYIARVGDDEAQDIPGAFFRYSRQGARAKSMFVTPFYLFSEFSWSISIKLA